MARICVFTGSKDGNNGYTRLARELGRTIGKRGHDLVYGGSNLGLMGELVNSYHKFSVGDSIGVVPLKYSHFERVEIRRINTGSIRQRKGIMERKSDAFIGLPGGYGTLDEICDLLCSKEGRDHDKPIVLLDHDGFFHHLLEFMNQIHREGFGRNVLTSGSVYVANNPVEAVEYIEGKLEVKS